MSPLTWMAFVIAGAAGAIARYVVDGVVTRRTNGRWVWGTFLINVTGSLLLGLITGLGLNHGFPRAPRLVLGTGFCGAYTTFSTFTFESVRLLEDGAPKAALWNIAGTFVAGALAAAAGLGVAAL
jgi:fluoride exporter